MGTTNNGSLMSQNYFQIIRFKSGHLRGYPQCAFALATFDGEGVQYFSLRTEPIFRVRTMSTGAGLENFVGTLCDQGIGLVHFVEYVGLDDFYCLSGSTLEIARHVFLLDRLIPNSALPWRSRRSFTFVYDGRQKTIRIGVP